MSEQGLRGRTDGHRGRDGQLLLQNDLNDSKRGTPQRVGIARSGGHNSYSKAAHNRIELVRKRHRATSKIAWDRIFEPHGTVVVIDSVGDLVRLSLRARLQTSDDSLQLGELSNHFRGQITFG